MNGVFAPGVSVLGVPRAAAGGSGHTGEDVPAKRQLTLARAALPTRDRRHIPPRGLGVTSGKHWVFPVGDDVENPESCANRRQ
jgi:hypothetical protein